MTSVSRLLTALLITGSVAAHAQFDRLKLGSISVGGTGQFTKELTSNPTPVTYPALIAGQSVQFVNQQQGTSGSAGFIAKLRLQPTKFAGVEFNYGYTKYSEYFTYNTTGYTTLANTRGNVRVKNYWHEATGAFIIQPKHIPFQPYVGIGGGFINFDSRDNQWRSAGLLETGFDLPVRHSKFGFRVGARSLYYRAPNYDINLLSTRSWRVTAEPEVSTYYKF